MAENTTYLFDPTPYSVPRGPARRRRRDPAVVAAVQRLGAALAAIPPEERARREARARALGVPRPRR